VQDASSSKVGSDIVEGRRSGILGAHSLDHYSVSVPDVAEGAAFYTAFGLDVRPVSDGFEVGAGGHWYGRYGSGAAKRLRYLSFGIFEDDVPAFRARLARNGIGVERPPSEALDDGGLWFRDPDGLLIELRVAEKCSPNAKAVNVHSSTPEGVAAAPLRAKAPRVVPRRLSHVLVFSSDVARSVAFFEVTVGLALSDAAGDGIAFMHGVHGSDHHLVAFAKSDAPGFHHCSWDVATFDDVGLGAMQMADAGHARGWGVGRHVLGSNYFHYVRDPWGSYCEYSHDIDYVPGDGSWRASHVSPENGFYLWGPAPPDDFAYNYESPSAALTRELIASE
jgi:catechol 2,3-dioxygenase-like lactoylglutathione lyase family enzyme